MISANNVTYRVGKKALFEDVNIKFTEGNCYGIIGANGAGKSTFLKILSGELETTNGDIAVTPGERLSVLEQDHFKYDDYTVMDTVIMGNKRLYEIMKEKDAIYAKEAFSDEDGIRVSDLEAEFAEMDGWEAESNAAMLLNGLGIDTALHYSVMKDLDSTIKVKVLLACGRGGVQGGLYQRREPRAVVRGGGYRSDAPGLFTLCGEGRRFCGPPRRKLFSAGGGHDRAVRELLYRPSAPMPREPAL